MENKFEERPLIEMLVNGYYAGHNVTDEIKEAFIKGLLYGLKNHSQLIPLLKN